MQLPSGPTGLVRARPSGPLSPVPAPLLGSQAWDTWGLCAHRAQRSAVHPGELLPLRPPGLPRPPPSALCSPLSVLASCLSESPSPPGQGPATWHRTQGFPGGEQDGRPGRRWEPGVSEGEGCCSGACVPAEGCSAPTLVPLLTPTPRRSSFPAPLSPGSPAPGPCFVVPEAAAAPRPAADFLGREEGKSGGVGEVCREQKPHGGPGVGRGLRGPRRRDFHSPESQGPREWDLSWKSNWMEAASGSSALGPSSGFLSSSWKPSAYSSQWCAPTLTVFSLVELGTHTRDLTFPLQSSFP